MLAFPKKNRRRKASPYLPNASFCGRTRLNSSLALPILDVETTNSSGRTNFNEMVKYLRKHPGVRVVLVEKTDRPYRNLKDWVTLDELHVEIHLAKE